MLRHTCRIKKSGKEMEWIDEIELCVAVEILGEKGEGNWKRKMELYFSSPNVMIALLFNV